MVRTRSFITLFFAVTMLALPSIYGMQEGAAVVASKKIAFSFDLDDVISGKNKVGFNDFIPLASMLWWCPMLVSAALPHNQQAIMDHVKKLTDEDKYNGSTNIIHGVIEYLKQNRYGDVSHYEQEINERTQKPFPVLRMIANIKALKELGYPVFGATNQDVKQYEEYSKHLKAEHGIDLNDTFDGIVTTPVYHIEQPAGDSLVYRANADDNVYVLRKKEHVKPGADFFRGVAQVVKDINPQIEEIIHTDDKAENCQGAQLAGLKGIHFKLSGETVRKTLPQDLEETIDRWETSLKTDYNISLKK